MLETESKDGAKVKAKLKNKSQVTIPKDIINKLGLHEGDEFDVKLDDNGHIVFIPVITIPRSQTWFWSQEWQKGEREADQDIAAGRIKKFNSVDNLIEYLDSSEEDE